MSAYPFHHMEEQSRRSSPAFTLVAIILLIGGGIYFVKHFQVTGLDKLSIKPKAESENAKENPLDELMFVSRGSSAGNPSPTTGQGLPASAPHPPAARPLPYVAKSEKAKTSVRIGSWAMSGFGPSKLANPAARPHLIRIIRQFDVIALQQVSAIERDLIPRLIDAVNEAGTQYDYAIGEPTGPADRLEQMVVIFNLDRVRIDRSQTYTVADPQNQLTYDPMVTWFRTVGPPETAAWTFSVVNVRINLARAPAEVALLPTVFSSVRDDGRGEDDVVMTGLFQADDSYLIPQIMGTDMVSAVRSSATDIFGRHQTCNILVDKVRTNEFLGRGGPVDFLRMYNLNLDQAQTVSSHLPIAAEFTEIEAGTL